MNLSAHSSNQSTRPTDFKERQKALNIKKSFLVKAPAGSGKTTLLMERFLKLLTVVDKPFSQIVAITFTRKATEQMRQKIFQELNKAQINPQNASKLALEVVERDKALGWDLLSQLGRLRIQTIDALVSDLLQQVNLQSPHHSLLGEHMRIVESPEFLYQKAAQNTLILCQENTHLAEHAQTCLHFFAYKQSALQQAIAELLKVREQWLLWGQSGGQSSLQQSNFFKRKTAEVCKALDSELQKVMSGEEKTRFKRLKSLFLNAKPEYLQENPRKEPHADQVWWQWFASHCLKKQGGIYKNLPKKMVESLGFKEKSAEKEAKETLGCVLKHLTEIAGAKECLDWLSVMGGALEEKGEAKSRPNDTKPLEQQGIESLLTLLHHAYEQLDKLFIENQLSDYSAKVIALLNAFKEQGAEQTLLKLDGSIDHILVDEFQDVSLSQMELLKCLTGNWDGSIDSAQKSLFLVGDAMQSIYSFRQAEVSLWQRLEKNIQKKGGDFDLFPIPLEIINLSANFRSQPKLVEGFNHAFATKKTHSLLQFNDDLSGAFVAQKAVSANNVNSAHSGSSPPLNAITILAPELEAKFKESDGGFSKEVAERINLVWGAKKEGESLALLVRKRKHGQELMYQMQKLGLLVVPFGTEGLSGKNAGENTIGADLLSLLEALYNPNNDLAWLELLRSGWLGLDLGQITQVLKVKAEAKVRPSAFERLNIWVEEKGKGVEKNDLTHLVGFVQAFNQVRSQSITLSEQVLLLWQALPYQKPLSSKDLLTARQFLTTLYQHAVYDLFSLKQFRLACEKQFIKAAHPKGQAIEVMTIHAAKGLEFDHTFIVGLDDSATERTPSSAIFKWKNLDDFYGLGLRLPTNATNAVNKPSRQNNDETAPSSCYAFLEKSYKAQANEEKYQRLSYVALTRAKQSATIALTKPIEAQTHLGWIKSLHTLDESVRVETIHPKPQAITTTQTFPVMCGVGGQGLSSTATQNHQTQMLGGDESPIQYPLTAEEKGADDGEGLVSYEWAGVEARRLGVLAHHMIELSCQWLERQNLSPTDTRPEVIRDELLKWVQQWAHFHMAQNWGLNESSASFKKGLSFAVETLSNMLSCEKGWFYLKPQTQAQNELSLVQEVKGNAKKAVIDRTFTYQEQRFIVDFKTSTHQGGQVKAFLLEESKRYEAQLKHYGKLWHQLDKSNGVGRDESDISLNLYFPLLKANVCWQMPLKALKGLGLNEALEKNNFASPIVWVGKVNEG